MRLPRRDPAPSPGLSGRPLVYRSVGALALGAVALCVGLVVGIDALVHDPGRRSLVVVGACLLGAALVVAVAVRPALIVRETGMVLRNPLRDVLIPWASVQDIRLGLSVDVRAGGRWHHSFAVQDSPRRQRRDAGRAGRQPDAGGDGSGHSWAARVHQEVQDLWAPHRRDVGARRSPAAPPPDRSAEADVRVAWSAVMLAWIGVSLLLLVAGLLVR